MSCIPQRLTLTAYCLQAQISTMGWTVYVECCRYIILDSSHHTIQIHIHVPHSIICLARALRYRQTTKIQIVKVCVSVCGMLIALLGLHGARSHHVRTYLIHTISCSLQPTSAWWDILISGKSPLIRHNPIGDICSLNSWRAMHLFLQPYPKLRALQEQNLSQVTFIFMVIPYAIPYRSRYMGVDNCVSSISRYTFWSDIVYLHRSVWALPFLNSAFLYEDHIVHA